MTELSTRKASFDTRKKPIGGTNSSEFRRNLAIVIGIDKYSNGIPPLATAVNDAKKLAQILEEQHGYSVMLLTDEEAALPRLQSLFCEEAVKSLSKDDRLLLYFAGHGVASDGDNGPEGFLIPQDATLAEETFWPMMALHSELEKLECRHMLAILDCCFAGAFRWSSKRAFQPLPSVIHKERYERFIRSSAWQVITSAAHNQKALDILVGNVLGAHGVAHQENQPHSPFALSLFEALNGGAADSTPKGGDGVITATELYLYLRDQVEVSAEQQADHQQTPGIWPLNRHEHGEFIFLTPGREVNLPPAPDLIEENNPYKGLSSYEKTDRKLFFGRTALIEELRQKVEKQSFTVVLGASGTGKSSLVKAGLLPVLEEDAKKSAEQGGTFPWFLLEKKTEKEGKETREVFRPGANPLAALRSLLASELAEQTVSTLAGFVTQWRGMNPGSKLLLVIDQAEELITLCRQEQERKDFVHELMQALHEHSEVLRVVLTLRSDFEAQISQTDFKEYWQDKNRFVVPPMSQNELREVIEQPASVMVLYFEPHELIDRLINEVIQTPGALPLLSFTLSELYLRYVKRQKDVEQQDGNRALTEADYQEIGGVIGSLRRRINQEYEQLDAAHQATMRRILLRMVAFEGSEMTRRRVPKWELEYPDAVENERVVKVVEMLSQARLVVAGESENSKGESESYIEPAHDALIVAWDKLLKWKAEEAETLLLHRQLTRAAADWQCSAENKEKKGLLWDNNPRLMRVQEILELKWSRGRGISVGHGMFRGIKQFCRVLFPSFKHLEQHIWLNLVENDFVRRSIERKRNWTQGVIAFILVVVVSLSAIAFIAWQQKGKAVSALSSEKEQRERAEANLRHVEAVQKATESEVISDKLSLESETLTNEPEAILGNTDKLFYSWGNSGGARDMIKAPSFTKHLRLAKEAVLKTLEKDHYVTREAFDALRKSVETAPPWKGVLPMSESADDISSPSNIAWSPDGTFFAAISGHGKIIVWNLINNKNIKIGETTIPATKGKEFNFSDSWLISWCGNSQFIVSESGETGAYLVNIESIERLIEVNNKPDAIAMCNNFRTQIIFISQNKLYTSQLNDIRLKHLMDVPEGINSLSLSPDGNYLSFIDKEGLFIQSLIDIKEKYAIRNNTEKTFFKAEWNLNENDPHLFVIEKANKGDEFFEVDFFKIKIDNSRLTESKINKETVKYPALFHAANKTAFSPDGRWLATAHGSCSFGNKGSSCDDVAVRIWSTETGKIVRKMYGHASEVTTICWHPNNQVLASGGLFNGGAGNMPDKRILLWTIEPFWNVNGWDNSNRLSQPFGDWLTTAFFEQDNIKVVIPPGSCEACAYDEEYLCLVSWNSFSRNWNLNGWQWEGDRVSERSSKSAPTVNLKDLLSSPISKDGKKELFWLNKGATTPAYSEESFGSDDDVPKQKSEEPNVVKITNQETRKVVRLIGHESWVSTAEWSPDGKRVLTSSSDGTVRIWDAEDGREMARYELDVPEFARATWSPDGTWILVGYPEIRIWPADVNELLKKAESLIKALDGENALDGDKQ